MDEHMVRHEDEIKDLWKADSEVKEDLGALRTDFEKLKTIVIGVDGKNGLNSRMRDSEKWEEKMEERLRDACKSCSPAELIRKHIEWHDDQKDKGITTARFYLTQGIVVFLSLLGLFVRVSGK